MDTDQGKKILAENIKEANAQITAHLNISKVKAYEPYLESIFYNLLSNAIKYHDKNRRLQIDISAIAEQHEVVLIISDNGLGIDLSKSSGKIFGLYQRFHDHIGGKGLGLYLVKTQVESMGGHIEISSTPGQGTTFKIMLPVQ
ncbi:MAG: ATP-binding protein [Cyclobacteriaceae bacterium]|nr:ATP-binding protein [Cyclobacteriaceae bacterium]